LEGILNKEFEDFDYLARGAYGVIFKAQRKSDKQRVAIKV
jgi:hypothetical protein